MITGEIKSQVDKILEAFITVETSNPLTVIEQFIYLQFVEKTRLVSARYNKC